MYNILFTKYKNICSLSEFSFKAKKFIDLCKDLNCLRTELVYQF